MHGWRMRASLIGVTAVAVSFAVSFGIGAANAEVAPGERERLEALFDRIWEWQMHVYPTFATYVGYPGQDDRWVDLSPEAISQRKADQRGFLESLRGIDASRLDADAQLDLELVLSSFEEAIEGFRFPSEYLQLSQMDGVQQDVPDTLEAMPSRGVEDYENRLARLRAVPALVEQTVALLEAGLDAGITQPRIVLRDVPLQVRNLLVEPVTESPLWSSFTELPDAIPESRQASLRSEAEAVLFEDVYPAYRRLLGFLEKTYLPGARETIGQSELPGGAAWYAYNVRSYTTTDLSPTQIHQIGLAEVERIRGEMQGIIQELGFDGSFEEFSEFLRTDPQFFFESESDLVAAYRDICKRVDPELVRLFGTLPRLPYGVKPVPDYKAKSAPTAYYQPGSLVAGRPGYFFANTYDLQTRPRWEMEALSLHEAVPGHHLQVALAQELEGVHDLLRHNFYTAFVEGWGLYAESLGAEVGLYRDPYARFGRLTYEIWRAIRLVVDTGMHAMDWNRDRAIEFFMQNTAKTEHDITVEVDRYIAWPGQALAYKIGELEIKRLRVYAQQRLGTDFDIRAFHDVVLLRGALPLEILEQRVEAWVERVEAESAERRTQEDPGVG